jgi:hypothetical protein
MVFHPVDALNGVDVKLGIGSTELKTVMAYSRFQPAVIEAPVVMAGNAVRAVTAPLPGLASHTIAHLKEVFRILPE